MTKDELFAAIKADIKQVEVKAAGVVVYIKALTGKARDEFHALVKAGDQSASHFEASLVTATVTDEHGVATFVAADVAKLQESNAAAVSAIAAAAMDVNKIGAAAEAIAAKN